MQFSQWAMREIEVATKLTAATNILFLNAEKDVPLLSEREKSCSCKEKMVLSILLFKY